MSDQPEALFLADVIENDPQSKAHHDAAAACLRRLHAECDALRVALLRLIGTGLDEATYYAIRSEPDHYVNTALDEARAALKEAK